MWLHRLFDVLVPFFTLYVFTVSYGLDWSEKYQILALVGSLILVIFSQSSGAYSHWRGQSILSGFKQVVQAWGLTWLSLLAITFLLKDSSAFSRVVLTAWAIGTPLVLFAYRMILQLLMGKLRSNGWNTKRVAILGCGDLGQRLGLTLKQAELLGYAPVAFFDDNPALTNQTFHDIPVRGSIDDFLNQSHLANQYDEVFITLPLRSEQRIKEILNALSNNTLTVKFIPDCFTFDLLHSHISDVGGMPVISVYDTPLNTQTNKIIKRAEDIVLSFIILILISPALLVIAIGVKLSSKGPILYKQKRVGWNGKEFTMYKFRSMPVDTDKEQLTWGGAKQKTNTKFGAFIRKTSLDELPQFFNVLLGNMSIVGPRPERKVFVEQFREEIPRYMQKHMVKAGITGWAQIHGWRGDTSIEKRIEFDLLYIDNWSLWLDIKIIVLTIIKGFIDKNAY